MLSVASDLCDDLCICHGGSTHPHYLNTCFDRMPFLSTSVCRYRNTNNLFLFGFYNFWDKIFFYGLEVSLPRLTVTNICVIEFQSGSFWPTEGYFKFKIVAKNRKSVPELQNQQMKVFLCKIALWDQCSNYLHSSAQFKLILVGKTLLLWVKESLSLSLYF